MNTAQIIPSRRRAVSLNFIAQLSGAVFVIVQGIFLVPLYLHFLGVALYGAWLASTQVVGWVTILDPGTDEVIRQRVAYAYGGRQLHEIGQLIGTGLVINTLIAICITAVALLLTPSLPRWFRVSGRSAEQLTTAATLLALASGTTVVAYAIGSSLQALQRAGGYGVVLIIGNVAGLALNVALLYAGWGLTAIAAGFLLKAALWVVGWGCVLIWICRPSGRDPVRLCFSSSQARVLFRLACYTLASKLAAMLQTSSDGVLTGIMLGPTQTAILTLTGRVVDAAKMIPDKIGAAMQPSLANLAGVGDREKSLNISTHFLTAVALLAGPLIATAVVLNRDVVRLWVGVSLYGGDSLNALIGISALLTLLTTAIYHVLFANGLIETTAKISLAAGVTKLVLLVILLPWLGLIAVPIATIAVILIVTAPRYVRAISITFSIEHRRQRGLFWMVLSGPLTCVAIAVLLAYTQSALTWTNAALKAGIVLGILAGMLLVTQTRARREIILAGTNVIARRRVRGLVT